MIGSTPARPWPPPACSTCRAERLDRLSGGERQRVMLARALAQRPRLLVLDEPTAHLDLRHQVECVGLLRTLNRGSGLGIVLVSHDLNMAAEICDRLLLLDRGAAVSVGTPEVVLTEHTLEAVYGCRPRRGHAFRHGPSYRPAHLAFLTT